MNNKPREHFIGFIILTSEHQYRPLLAIPHYLEEKHDSSLWIVGMQPVQRKIEDALARLHELQHVMEKHGETIRIFTRPITSNPNGINWVSELEHAEEAERQRLLRNNGSVTIHS